MRYFICFAMLLPLLICAAPIAALLLIVRMAWGMQSKLVARLADMVD